MANDKNELVNTVKPQRGTFTIGEPLDPDAFGGKGVTKKEGGSSDPIIDPAKKEGGQNNQGGGTELFTKAEAHMDDELKAKFDALESDEEKKEMAEAVIKLASGEKDAASDGEGDEDEKTPKVVSNLKQHLGFETEVDYPEDFSGVEQLVNDYVGKAFEEKENDVIQNHFKKVPSLGIFNDFLEAGLSPAQFASFMSNEEVSNRKLDENTPASTLKAVIKQSLGDTDEDVAESILAKYEEDGKLLEKAKVIDDKLKQVRKQQMTAIKAKAAEQREADAKIRQKELAETVNLLKTGDLGIAKIPQEDLKPFINFIGKRGEDGLTEYDKKEEQLSTAQILYLKYQMFKDFQGTGTTKTTDKKIGATDFEKLTADRFSSGQAGKGQKGKMVNFAGLAKFYKEQGKSKNLN